METMDASRALSALGHETRLSIFRLLVQAGPAGAAAGDIARALELAPNALSFHLKDLSHAGLVSSRAAGHYVVYSANFASMNDLIGFLTENCCGGAGCEPAPPSARTTRREA
jgi:ArsR family transcriptional regulator, arsenate/arsenite/antimonite-responsive transcriptional repressor